MNYADIKLGTWFPMGGMYSVVGAMYELAKELGVQFYFDHNVFKIAIENNIATTVFAVTEASNQPAIEVLFTAMLLSAQRIIILLKLPCYRQNTEPILLPIGTNV